MCVCVCRIHCIYYLQCCHSWICSSVCSIISVILPFPTLIPCLPMCVCARSCLLPITCNQNSLANQVIHHFLRTWAHARTACARAHSFHELKTLPSLTRPSLKTHQVHEEALCDGVGMAMAVKQRIEARVRGLNGRLASWLRVLFFCCVEQREHLLQDVFHRPRYLHINQSKHTT